MHPSHEGAANAATIDGAVGAAPTASPYVLSDDVRDAVNRWVAMQAAGSRTDAVAARALQQATAARLCAEARHMDAVRVERLLIALHQCWPQLPAVRDERVPERRQELLERLVAACIAAFYERAPDPAR